MLTRILLVGLVLLVLASPAAATPVPGENGRIVFSSGRNLGETARELFFLPVISSTGGGTLSAPIVSLAGQQNRHPTWSPDRTKIAFTRAANGAAPFEVWVQDLTQPLSLVSPENPKQITVADGFNKDRPAWSPDGRHIAWEQNAAAMQRDIVVALPSGGGQQNITQSVGFEGDPAWSPDSGTIFYEKGNAFADNNTNIVKRTISGTASNLTVGSEVLAVADSGLAEMQPSVSPNGDKICFTIRDAGAGNTSGEVLVADLPSGGNGKVISVDTNNADYNCAFSPDNTLVAWVTGTGNNSASLVMARADDTSPSPIPLADDVGSNDFDGNPDWAPDGRPECPDSSVDVNSNESVSIPVECTDTGPAYERSTVRESVIEQPQNGTTEQQLAGDPVIYTPNPAFVGTDSFKIRSFDEFGFGADQGTVTVNVIGRLCAGTPSTIGATEGDDVITGTPGPDVINGLGGNDTIKGANGKDSVCGGLGNDKLSGGKGKDRLIGGKGKDRLNGGKSKDRCSGGPQKDRISACE